MSFFTIAGEKRKKRGSKLLAFKKISFFPYIPWEVWAKIIWSDAIACVHMERCLQFNLTGYLTITNSIHDFISFFFGIKSQKCIGFRNLTVCLFRQLKARILILPIFLKTYHFMFHFMSSLVTWDVVILVHINNPQNTCLVTWLLMWSITFWVKYSIKKLGVWLILLNSSRFQLTEVCRICQRPIFCWRWVKNPHFELSKLKNFIL